MQKPVDIIEQMIRASVPEGGTVFNPFCGTGSTLLAAKRTGRKAVGCEIERTFCDTAAGRVGAEMDFHTANAEAHGRAVARTVQPLVGSLDGDK